MIKPVDCVSRAKATIKLRSCDLCKVIALHLSPQSIHSLSTLSSPYNTQKRSIYVNNAVVACA